MRRVELLHLAVEVVQGAVESRVAGHLVRGRVGVWVGVGVIG